MRQTCSFSLAVFSALLFQALTVQTVSAQTPTSQSGGTQIAQQTQNDDYLPPWQRGQSGSQAEQPGAPQRISPPQTGGYSGGQAAPPPSDRYDERTTVTRGDIPPPRDYEDRPARDDRPPVYEDDDSYSSNEIVAAGHRFFGGVSKGLANVVEHAFGKQGRPNGYILGEEAGGAFVAGLRYGEGTLYTKNAGTHRVYWQGPSLGYDFGAEGSKTMILVYNLRDVDEIYHRFAGVDGSAYFVGGVGITFQSYDDIVLAPIRAGVGLRLGANVGYLKYTRTPTWNPF
jgi:hypothetical protein